MSLPSATLQGTGIQNVREKCLDSAWEGGQISTGNTGGQGLAAGCP